MKLHPKRRWNYKQVFVTVAVFLVVVGLTGCNFETRSLAVHQSPATPMTAPSVTPSLALGAGVTNNHETATPSLQDQSATKVAELEAEHSAAETRIAGNIGVTVTPFVIATAVPMSTPILGLSGTCADGNPYFMFTDCWAGKVGEEYLFVSSGAPHADRLQGAIVIYTTTLDQIIRGPRQYYPTMTKVGAIRISDVSWPLMRLSTESSPPSTFTFNLAIRQWVSLTPQPTPSTTP
jgi:hypothetical protein